MCAICGIFHVESERPVNGQQLRRMARSMQHRGPDSEGFYVGPQIGLGHQRLSILDLSEAGHQPMTTDDGRYWIVFNGEIYNYIELRRRLRRKGYTFRSNSDTEVLLKLYEAYGTQCLELLNGMFAFAIWDTQERRLFAARDRFGIKPFYYHYDGHTFSFASEIKALVRAGLVTPALNPEGMADYLTFQYVLGEKTLFDGVNKLLPGHFLTLDADGKLAQNCYWYLPYTLDTDHSPSYFERRLEELLHDAVRLRLRADVPVGAHLSGGLDSSTIASLAGTHSRNRIHTFTGAFREGPAYDESAYARMVAEQIGSRHHEVIPGPELVTDVLPRMIYHLDEPAAGPGVLPQMAVSARAARHVKVVLGGQGGDELFGGYTRYLIAYLEECMRGAIDGDTQTDKYVVSFASILPNLQELKQYRPLMQHFWSDGLFEPMERRYFRLIDRSSSTLPLVTPDLKEQMAAYSSFESYRYIFDELGTASYINRMTRYDSLTLLPALLHIEDRTSMAVSLESRVPLLDHRIAELMASIPPKIKFAGGRSKRLFREVTKDIVPSAIAQRKDKMGFPVPLTRWYREAPEVRSFVMDTLRSQQSRTRGFFDVEELTRLMDEEQAYGRAIWGALSLELWASTFLDAADAPTEVAPLDAAMPLTRAA